MSILKQKYTNVGIHVVIWVTLLALPELFFHNAHVFGLPHSFFTLGNIYHIGLFYLNAYWLYPKLLNKRFWWLYFPCLAVILIVSYWLKVFLLHIYDPSIIISGYNFRVLFFPPVPFLIASIIFRYVLNSIRSEKLEKERKAERLSSELKFLRNQISPHFLFNMLTNMISLARQKSDLLEPLLIKLSDMLRYTLYETGNERFNVSRELEYLRNYIELQQIRFEDSVEIKLQIENINEHCFIEPMLLIPFVENAFKHGVGMVMEAYIHIHAFMKESRLVFSVVNNYATNFSKDKSSGIGIQNVKNRLELLYPDKYSLQINNDGSVFDIKLNIDLVC